MLTIRKSSNGHEEQHEFNLGLLPESKAALEEHFASHPAGNAELAAATRTAGTVLLPSLLPEHMRGQALAGEPGAPSMLAPTHSGLAAHFEARHALGGV